MLEPTNTEVRPAQAGDAAQIAALHIEVFAGHTLATFGPKFLSLYYRSVIESPAGLVMCALRNERVVGFVAGMLDARGFYRSLLRRRALSFLVLGCVGAISRPHRLIRLRRGLTFHREHAADPGAANLS